MRAQYLKAFLAALLVAGCTTFYARQVNPQDPNVKGILVPSQIPLLVIHNGQTSIVMVNNPDRATAIQFGAFLAKHDVQIDFMENGQLKTLKSNQDSTAIPLKLLEVAGNLAQHVLPEGQGLSGTQSASTSLQIYRIEFRDGNVERLVPLLHPGGNFPPPQLTYQPVAVTGETPVNQLKDKANPQPKGN